MWDKNSVLELRVVHFKYTIKQQESDCYTS